MKRKIKYASFQAGISVPGLFGADTTVSDLKHKGCDMELEPGLLVIKYKGEEVLVPLTNVKAMHVEPQVEEDASKDQSRRRTA